jgi:predicted RNase H-like HicB family nuclease
MRLIVTLTKGEDGYIVAECPYLPGCLSQGKTKEEALSNIKEAIELSLETHRENEFPLPFEIAEIEVPVVNA